MANINYNSHFKDLFENTSDLIHFLNADGIIELVNPAWLSNMGYQKEDVVGRSIYEFIHEDCKEEYRETRSEVMSTKKSIEQVTTFMTKTNQQVLLEGQVNIFFSDDRGVYTRGVFKNISARKKAEKEKENSEKRLTTFFQSGPDAIIVIDQNQQILEWNPKAEAIFGYAAADVIGGTLSTTIIPHQYREAHNQGMRHFLQTGEGPVLNKTIEITALHKDGHEFHINLSISNVKLDGEWIFIAFLSDITQRKKTEEELIRKEAELMQAKLLEEKKDEFISIASHELKTPLTTIKAYAQLALNLPNEKCSDDVQRCLVKVDQFAGKLNFLINNLLDVSRVHGGKLSLNKTEVAMDTFLTEVLSSMQQIIPDHKLIIERNESVMAYVDALRLEQVITNIISNAAKYSPGKEKIIVASAKKDSNLIVSITDFGIGISEEKIHQIFDRFYRVDDASKKFSGLGIGLFISSEIIKQHNGTIWVDSKEGEGSTFYFSIPLAELD